MRAKKESDEFETQVIANLLPLYEQLDTHALQMVKDTEEEDGKPVSCAKGCTHCCYQLTNVLFAEGILIAAAMFKKKNWMAIAKDLKAAAKKCHGPELSRGDYFREGNACPLLDVEKKECTIYDERPSACRFLYVISPADDCSRDNEGKQVLALNMTKLETTVWEFSTMVSGGAMVAAPLPIMVLFCMQARAPSKKAEKYLKHLCMGVPDPVEWIQSLEGNDKIFAEDAPDTREAVVRSMSETEGMFSLEDKNR